MKLVAKLAIRRDSVVQQSVLEPAVSRMLNVEGVKARLLVLGFRPWEQTSTGGFLTEQSVRLVENKGSASKTKRKQSKETGYPEPDLQRFDSSDGRLLKAESFLKNEATDLLDNKGPTLGEMRNEATVSGQEDQKAVCEEKGKNGKRQMAKLKNKTGLRGSGS